MIRRTTEINQEASNEKKEERRIDQKNNMMMILRILRTLMLMREMMYGCRVTLRGTMG